MMPDFRPTFDFTFTGEEEEEEEAVRQAVAVEEILELRKSGLNSMALQVSLCLCQAAR